MLLKQDSGINSIWFLPESHLTEYTDLLHPVLAESYINTIELLGYNICTVELCYGQHNDQTDAVLNSC